MTYVIHGDTRRFRAYPKVILRVYHSTAAPRCPWHVVFGPAVPRIPLFRYRCAPDPRFGPIIPRIPLFRSGVGPIVPRIHCFRSHGTPGPVFSNSRCPGSYLFSLAVPCAVQNHHGVGPVVPQALLMSVSCCLGAFETGPTVLQNRCVRLHDASDTMVSVSRHARTSLTLFTTA